MRYAWCVLNWTQNRSLNDRHRNYIGTSLFPLVVIFHTILCTSVIVPELLIVWNDTIKNGEVQEEEPHSVDSINCHSHPCTSTIHSIPLGSTLNGLFAIQRNEELLRSKQVLSTRGSGDFPQSKVSITPYLYTPKANLSVPLINDGSSLPLYTTTCNSSIVGPQETTHAHKTTTCN